MHFAFLNVSDCEMNIVQTKRYKQCLSCCATDRHTDTSDKI